MNKYVLQTPKSYKVEEVNGRLEVVSYDSPLEQNLKSDFDEILDLPLPESFNLSESKEVLTLVTDIFNDIWIFNLSSKIENISKWAQISAHVPYGGCYTVNATEICTHPGERYFHTGHVINNTLLIVLGGYSEICNDLCSDLWFYSLWDSNATWIRRNWSFGPSKS